MAGLALWHFWGWSTQPLRLADGRTFAVLNFDRHLSYVIQPDGTRRAERYFWVRYYTSAQEPAAMLEEARSLAPALYPIADSLGFGLIELTPSRPLLFRRFPITVISTQLRFARDSSGRWREVRS